MGLRKVPMDGLSVTWYLPELNIKPHQNKRLAKLFSSRVETKEIITVSSVIEYWSRAHKPRSNILQILLMLSSSMLVKVFFESQIFLLSHRDPNNEKG